MAHEIKLDGGEITVLKSLGLSGAPVQGKVLRERAGEMETAEFLDTLQGLISQDYVAASKVNVRTLADVDSSFFRVNASCARDLRDAIVPGRKRDQERTKRRRRS